MKNLKDYINETLTRSHSEYINEWKVNDDNKSSVITAPSNRDDLVELVVQRLRINIQHPDFSGIDTSKITNMSHLFDNFEDNTLRTVYKINLCDTVCIDISSWDTSNVETMEYMFSNCENVEKIIVNGLDTSKVTNMQSMFYKCRNIMSLDLSSFDVSKVNNMNHMFNRCDDLTQIKGIENWDVSLANLHENLYWMFFATNKIKLPKWYDRNIYEKSR